MKKADIGVALYLLAAVIFFIVPISSNLLDVMLALNISIALIVGGAAAGIGLAAFGVPVSVSLGSVLSLIGFCVLIGGVFGVYPAIKAARMPPVEALRAE